MECFCEYASIGAAWGWCSFLSATIGSAPFMRATAAFSFVLLTNWQTAVSQPFFNVVLSAKLK
jgi:hypothetical protein